MGRHENETKTILAWLLDYSADRFQPVKINASKSFRFVPPFVHERRCRILHSTRNVPTFAATNLVRGTTMRNPSLTVISNPYSAGVTNPSF